MGDLNSCKMAPVLGFAAVATRLSVCFVVGFPAGMWWALCSLSVWSSSTTHPLWEITAFLFRVLVNCNLSGHSYVPLAEVVGATRCHRTSCGCRRRRERKAGVQVRLRLLWRWAIVEKSCRFIESSGYIKVSLLDAFGRACCLHQVFPDMPADLISSPPLSETCVRMYSVGPAYLAMVTFYKETSPGFS